MFAETQMNLFPAASLKHREVVPLLNLKLLLNWQEGKLLSGQRQTSRIFPKVLRATSGFMAQPRLFTQVKIADI